MIRHHGVIPIMEILEVTEASMLQGILQLVNQVRTSALRCMLLETRGCEAGHDVIWLVLNSLSRSLKATWRLRRTCVLWVAFRPS